MIHLPGTLAVILAFWTHSVASGGEDSPADGSTPEQGVVTREWRWADGGGITVFTAQGPAEQVAAFEPGDPPSRCPDCVLMSSFAFPEPDASASVAVTPDQPADPSGDRSR